MLEIAFFCFIEGRSMKENIKNILSRTIITYTFLLLIVLILKIVGFNRFGIDINNSFMLKLNSIISKYNLENVWYAITLYINVYIVLAITCNDNSKKMKIYTLICMPLCIYIQCVKNGSLLFVLLDFFYIFLLGLIYKKFKFNKDNILNYVIYFVFLNSFFQIISLSTRNFEIMSRLQGNFIVRTIMSIDYILISIIFYKFYFLKGGKSIWTAVHYYGLHLMTESKQLLKRLQRKLNSKKKKLTKQEKVYNFVFYTFVILYNLASMAVIFLIAYFIGAVIECIFITLCFWFNKFAFGKPFHAKDSKTCFIISSASYIILNKLAVSTIGISLLWQVILGVMFSFITSRFVKNTIKNLYKGMPIEEFDKKILKVTDKDSLHYKICYMYYIERKSELEISHNVSYSIDNIKKIKSKINKKVVELN